MTEITDLSVTDSSNTTVTGESIDGAIANMGRMDNTLQAILGLLARSIRTNVLRFLDNADPTKKVALDLSGLPTATERTWTAPYYSGTLGLVSDIRGQIYGLTLSNNVTDATNDIDIAAGAAVDSTGVVSMLLASGLTKQLDAVWAVGNNAGMRASGAAITNTTYHIFIIRRPDTGVVDIAADTSVTGANIAANTNVAYTQIRRIGSIVRESGSITQFFQRGRSFSRPPLIYYSQSNPGTSAFLAAAPVPLGINVKAQIVASIATTATSSDYGLLISDLNVNQVSATTAICTANLQTLSTAGVYRSAGYAEVTTDLSARTRVQISRSDANTTISLMCYGWEDLTL